MADRSHQQAAKHDPRTSEQPNTEPWPEGVEARYLTVAGATVDVRGSGNHVSMTCLGCGLHYSAFGEDRTRELAQGHAAMCRGLPRPAVTG